MKINELIKLKTVKVPGTDIVVKLKTDIPWFDYLESTKIKDSTERGVFTLAKMIDSWNLKNEDDSIAEISEENIKKLTSNVAMELIGQINQVFDFNSEKKKSFPRIWSFIWRASALFHRRSM